MPRWCVAPPVFRRCWWRRWCSGRWGTRLWGRAAWRARGRRPAREPSAPRAFGSARRLEARPGPATAHGHRSQAPPPPTGTVAKSRGQPCRHGNFACNSLLAISNFEFVSLELQRFWALLKVHAIELHAKLGEGCVIGARLGCGGVLVRDFFRPACRVGGGSGTKLSLLAQNGPKTAFWGVLGEFCTGWARRGCVLGEFCTGYGPARLCRMNSGSSRTWRKFVDGRRA